MEAGYLGDDELWKTESRRNGLWILLSEECDTLVLRVDVPHCGTVL